MTNDGRAGIANDFYDGYTVAPADTVFTPVEVELPDGSTGTVLAPLTQTAPSAATAKADEPSGPLAAPYWKRVGAQCFARIDDVWAWMDHCYHMYKEVNDGNSNYDFFALKRFATMGRNHPWRLWDGRVRATRGGGASQTWIDWHPRSDWSGGSCNTITVGISSPIGGISESFQRCPDTWDMWKSANGQQPDYHLTWRGNATAEREVAFEISVRVAQGGSPVWGVPAFVHGGPA